MSIREDLRYLLAAWGAGLRSALEYRAAFAMQAGFMLLNNMLWLSFWAVFFARFPHVGGWTLRQMAMLYACGSTAFGITVLMAGGALDLARAIAEGRVDTWLLRPRPVLVQALTGRTRVSGFGDIASGVLLMVLTGNLGARQLATWALVAGVASVALASFWVTCGTLAFWLGRADAVASQASNAVVMFALYPPGLFPPGLRLVLYLVVPAGIVGWLPAAVLEQWRWAGIARLLAGAALAACVAGVAWAVGIRRYESGNLTQAVEE